VLILTAPIGLDRDYFLIKHMLNKGLKFKKVLINLRLMTKQVYPGKLAIIVNEGNIIPLATKGFNSMTPDIRKNELQRSR
jgi:hypothetical protein